MPGKAHAPRFCIMSGLDLREWSGIKVFTHNGFGVTLPTYGVGEGVLEDALDFLNGRGTTTASHGDAASDLIATWTGVGNGLDVFIGYDGVTPADNDRVVFEADEAFTILPAATNRTWGIDALGQASVLVGAVHQLAGAYQWVRGNHEQQQIWIKPGSGVGFLWPSYDYRTQSVVTFVRKHGEGDADDQNPTDNLEEIHAAAVASNHTRWGIDADGYCWVAWPTGAALGAITWSSTTFRDRLGFTGGESVVSAGNLDTITADNPMPGIIVPRLPMRRRQAWSADRGHATELTNGTLIGQHIATIRGYTCEFWVTGLLDRTDHERHWFERVLPYLTQGDRVAVYQEWGDPRRATSKLVIATPGYEYDELQTPEMNGRRGRLRCRLSPDPARFDWQPDTPGGMELRAPMILDLHEAGD